MDIGWWGVWVAGRGGGGGVGRRRINTLLKRSYKQYSISSNISLTTITNTLLPRQLTSKKSNQGNHKTSLIPFLILPLPHLTPLHPPKSPLSNHITKPPHAPSTRSPERNPRRRIHGGTSLQRDGQGGLRLHAGVACAYVGGEGVEGWR